MVKAGESSKAAKNFCWFLSGLLDCWVLSAYNSHMNNAPTISTGIANVTLFGALHIKRSESNSDCLRLEDEISMVPTVGAVALVRGDVVMVNGQTVGMGGFSDY